MVKKYLKTLTYLCVALFIGNCGLETPLSTQSINHNPLIAQAMTPQGEISAIIAKGGMTFCFARGTDNNLYYRSRPKNGSWSTTWTSLGGPIYGNIATARDDNSGVTGKDSSIFVFSWNSSNKVMVISRNTYGVWSSWTTFSSGPSVNGVIAAGNLYGNMNVGPNASFCGIMAIIRAGDSKLYYLAGGANYYSVVSWQSWNMIPNSPLVSNQIATSIDEFRGLSGAENRICAINQNNEIITNVLMYGGSGPQNWRGFENWGGPFTGEIAMEHNLDGRLEVFAGRTSNGSLWHRYELTASTGSGWSQWEQLANSGINGDVSRISAIQNPDGRIEVVYNGIQSLMVHQYQTAPNSAWSGTQNFEYGAVTTTNHIGISHYGDDNRLVVFGKNGSNVYCSSQTAVNSWWTAFTAFSNN